jgi:hypothetical protein
LPGTTFRLAVAVGIGKRAAAKTHLRRTDEEIDSCGEKNGKDAQSGLFFELQSSACCRYIFFEWFLSPPF